MDDSIQEAMLWYKYVPSIIIAALMVVYKVT